MKLILGAPWAVAASMIFSGCGATTDTGPGAPSTARMAVVSMIPAPRTVRAEPGTALTFRFDRPVRRDSVVLSRTLVVFGRWSGTARGRIGFAEGDRTVVFVPERPFSAGESVTVLLSHDVRAADGAPLRQAGWSAQFWIASRPAAARFLESARMSTRAASRAPVRAYGGVASDLDGDGHLDLAIVNEDAPDLVVFRNRGNGVFDPLPGRVPLGRRASPSEPADFDHDGDTDIAVANITDGTVSILSGRGDGTFDPPQVVAVGAGPRGIAVLDADGDADFDIATANVTSDDVTVLFNDGRGRFSAGFRAETGGRREWGLAAADMDEDGVLDLVAGTQEDQRIVVLRNTGEGRLEPLGSQAAGGGVWMIATGDVDGDGHDDVATSNGRSNSASVLRGNGAGSLGAPVVHPIDPFGLASDLGDVDGDGDLDWVTSSFGGRWTLFENSAGSFVTRGLIVPRQAASCALVFDADGDGDLDLGLIDEIEDEVIVALNDGP